MNQEIEQKKEIDRFPSSTSTNIPFPRETRADKARPSDPAATVISHGAVLLTVPSRSYDTDSAHENENENENENSGKWGKMKNEREKTKTKNSRKREKRKTKMKTKIGMRKNEKRKRENENEKLRKKRETKNENKKRNKKRKWETETYLLLFPFFLLRFSQFFSTSQRKCRPRVGERVKREWGEREKRESGRETVITNITYNTNIIVTDIISYDIVMYVYRGVKMEEKRASPDTNSIMYIDA